ncbi:B3/B4 domain-containing protein [Halopseudomonas salegens]|uniref:B3/B4 domain-containing protein (DNA/RNA-binding domain of Phe-tRNA-synthetase) n=1 Tax=Halopseudomonas salegens TaxID=1434072 RepID=A0A1H2HG12_9GAMM|nr:phenylalanine--tRNA ligase beta subunit-related protein [Halopseudomonas salegens]SDU30774.1 B3/B4 domain-containing protein (DNA/RNA-binding domain of Phe-tRNA-synthetase) [Halopseudomonas salegens]
MLNPIFRLLTPDSLGLKVIAFTVHGLCNRHFTRSLNERLAELDEQLDLAKSRLHMAGFDDLRLQVGRSARRYPASPQTLLQQFLRDAQLRSIAPVVDLYNHWSLVSGLSIGAHDLRYLSLPVSLTLGRGHEEFIGLGNDQVQQLPSGEYLYLDADQQVICRMDYRQCAATALQADSREALVIVQGHADTPLTHLRTTAEALQADLNRYCTGPEQGTQLRQSA